MYHVIEVKVLLHVLFFAGRNSSSMTRSDVMTLGSCSTIHAEVATNVCLFSDSVIYSLQICLDLNNTWIFDLFMLIIIIYSRYYIEITTASY